MTRICTYHQPDHHMTVEHLNYIDMNPYPTDLDGQKPCYRCTISTYIPGGDIGSFGDQLNARRLLKYFNLRMTPFTGTKNAWFTLLPRYNEYAGRAPFTPEEAARGMMDLITFLNGARLPIIWKEDGRGYRIATGGVICRKWELLPDNVPF